MNWDWAVILKRWSFAAVPLVGVLELLGFAKQSTSALPDQDWEAAKQAVTSAAQPDDLVLFAPRWADQLGREHFGNELASVEREARPDDTRWKRAFEVSVRGAHAKELAGWREVEHRSFGAITVTTYENPAPATLLDDLLLHVGPDKMSVAVLDPGGHEQPCSWGRGPVESGNLGYGPAHPGERFNCAGTNVGISVVANLDYTPHRCIFLEPPGGRSVRLRFRDVAFGTVIHGHHGLYVEAERDKAGAPVTLTFQSEGTQLASFVHTDGQGWKEFDINTSSLDGQRGELVVDVATAGGAQGKPRKYCFEADTR